MQCISTLIMRLLLLCTVLTLTSGYYLAVDYPDTGYLRPAKKSQIRALAGSRNCFFSPINCVITERNADSYRRKMLYYKQQGGAEIEP